MDRFDQSDDLVVGHLGLARSLARRFAGRGEPLEDLQGVAHLALVRAARHYDPERGVAFVSFATVSISGELKRHFRDRVWSVRPPRRIHDLVMHIGEARETLHQRLGRSPTVADIAGYLRCSEEDVLEAMEAANGYRADSTETPLGQDGLTLEDLLGHEDVRLANAVDRAGLQEALSTLSDEDRYLLKAYFFDDRTQADISRVLNCSQMQVSRLLTRLLARLRHDLQAGPPDPVGS